MKKLLASLIAACAITTSANAAEFARLRTDIIGISGEIVSGDTARLYEAVADMRQRGESVKIILLNSNGGDLDEGIGLANYVHAENVGVMVGGNDQCASICMLIFAAAKARAAREGTFLGVHSVSSYDTADASLPSVEDRNAMASTTELARRMAAYGAPASIVAKLVTTPANEIASLDADDLNGWVSIIERDTQSEASIAAMEEFRNALN